MKARSARSSWEERAPAAAAVPQAARAIIRNLDEILEPALRYDGCTVGIFARRAGDGRTVLRKVVDPEAHMLRRPPAWAIAQAHYQRLCELGGAGVELLARDGRRWWAPVEAFKRHAFAVRRAVDPQVALPLPYWRASGPDGQQLDFFSLFDTALAGAAGGAP